MKNPCARKHTTSDVKGEKVSEVGCRLSTNDDEPRYVLVWDVHTEVNTTSFFIIWHPQQSNRKCLVQTLQVCNQPMKSSRQSGMRIHVLTLIMRYYLIRFVVTFPLRQHLKTQKFYQGIKKPRTQTCRLKLAVHGNGLLAQVSRLGIEE